LFEIDPRNFYYLILAKFYFQCKMNHVFGFTYTWNMLNVPFLFRSGNLVQKRLIIVNSSILEFIFFNINFTNFCNFWRLFIQNSFAHTFFYISTFFFRTPSLWHKFYMLTINVCRVIFYYHWLQIALQQLTNLVYW
jgi:hypothetical protein